MKRPASRRRLDVRMPRMDAGEFALTDLIGVVRRFAERGPAQKA